MKKSVLYFLAAMLLLNFAPKGVNAAKEPDPVSMADNKMACQNQSGLDLQRLNELKARDLSGLSPAEKKVLRTEVKDIKKRLKKNEGGVYVSVGAIIIIIILLIILL
jgi:hypothetical protein